MDFLRKIGKRYALGLVERFGAVIDKKLVEIACFTSSMLQRKQKPNVLFTSEKAAPSGTIENVGCKLPPETKRRNLHRKN